MPHEENDTNIANSVIASIMSCRTSKQWCLITNNENKKNENTIGSLYKPEERTKPKLFIFRLDSPVTEPKKSMISPNKIK